MLLLNVGHSVFEVESSTLSLKSSKLSFQVKTETNVLRIKEYCMYKQATIYMAPS